MSIEHPPSFYRKVFDISMEAIFLTDLDGAVYAANPAACQLFGRTEEEICNIGLAGLVDILASPQLNNFLAERLSTGKARSEFTFIRGDGTRFPGETSSIKFLDESGQKRTILSVRELTKDKQATARILKLSQLYGLLSHTNTTIVHSKNQEELLRNICKGAVEKGNFLMAWVGLVDEETKKIIPFCHEGAEDSYLTNISISADDKAEGKSPIGTAIRKNEVFYINNLATDERVELWRDLISAHGYGSSAGLPLRLNGKVIGALALYSSEPSFFDDDQLILMNEMTDDISFALDNFFREVERRRIENDLTESESRFHALIDGASVAIGMSRFGKSIYVNRKYVEMFGYEDVNELIGTSIGELWSPKSRKVVEEYARKRSLGLPVPPSYDQLGLRKDGTTFPVHLDVTTLALHEGMVSIAFFTDLTDRLSAEEKIKNYVTQLEGMMRNTLQAVAKMVEMRDPYTAGHEERVGLIAKDIAREMGLPDDKCNYLELVGLVHDIGKIAIPAEILVKPGRLTSLEFDMVKTHAEKGYEILKDVDFPLPIAEIVYQHHERMDGSGYPRQLIGDEILLEARILAVADVLESMTSHRPYRPSLGMEVALQEMEANRGNLYDETVVDTVLKMIKDDGYELPI